MQALLGEVAVTLGLPRDTAFEPLGAGRDHRAFAVDDLVVRVDLGDEDGRGERVEREAALLGLVASVSPVAVPEPVAVRADLGVLVVRRVPGASALDRPPSDIDTVAGQLAALVRALAAVDRTTLDGLVEVDATPPEEYLVELGELAGTVRGELDVGQRRLLDAFLAAPAPSPPAEDELVFCHHDLGAEHVLLDAEGRLVTGVIDWSDAAIADPAHDLGRLLRDLGPAVALRCRDALGRPGGEHLLDRVVFHARCSLVEDLAFGIEEGDRRYADAALAAFERVVGGAPR